MSKFAKPLGVELTGRPECVPNADHWTRHWTVADCMTHFEVIPAAFRLFDPAAKVAGIWHFLTLGMQNALEHEFVFYDLKTGRV